MDPTGRTYAFDSSTTAFALVSTLPDLPYRVITNAFAVFQQLVTMQTSNHLTGGTYHPKTHTFVGSDSENPFDAIISKLHLFPVSVLITNAEREGFEQQATFNNVYYNTPMKWCH